MRTLAFIASLLALTALGCGESHSSGLDGGTDAGDGVDAGPPDSGPPDSGPPDTGAPILDAGRDTGTTDAGPILPPIDAGDPFGDAGALGTPEWVPLDIRVDGTSCDPLVACGGDVVGTWDVTGGCFEVPMGDALDRCPGAAVTRSEGRARGRVIFDALYATRTGQSEVYVEIFIPGFCASFVGGCAGIETQMRRVTPDTRCVTSGEGDCNCAARNVSVIDDADAYTLESNQIVSVTAPTERRWDYCIEGTTLRYHEINDREPGIMELGRR